MSNFPFVLQAALGLAEAEAGVGSSPRTPRNETLTANTPATFELNWGFCENDSGNPIAQPGVTTLMGPPTTEESGKGVGWEEAQACILVFVTQELRNASYSIRIIPDGYDDANNYFQSRHQRNTEDTEKPKSILSLKERELHYIKGDSFLNDCIEIRDGNQELVATFTTVTMDNPCLRVQWNNPEFTETLRILLDPYFDLAEIPQV